MAENLCSMYANNFKLNIKTIRFFSIYGLELRKQLLWDACNKLKRGVTEFPGTGNETRDWINVADAVKLIEILTTTNNAAYEIVNGGTGVAVSVSQIIKELALHLSLPEGLSFNGQSRAGDPFQLVANPSFAQNQGWCPQVSWIKGVADYVNWYKTTST
jgi:UDP-glucose 4-epimerase